MKKLLQTLSLLLFAIFSATAAPVLPRVSVLTCMAGSEIYELEGHTGLRFDYGYGRDFTVNWGVFDFNSPNFVYRFVKGETDYLAAVYPTSVFLGEYAAQGRAVVEQTLNLDSATVRRLESLVDINLRPENRVYRYNYVLDNCATRPLAIIEAAIGDTITLAPSGLDPQTDGGSFRRVMRRFHRHYPWYQFGIDMALGSGIDRPITAREASFAPELLRNMLAGATLPSGEPLVSHTGYAVGSSSTPPVPLGPTPFMLTPLFWGWAVFALAFGASALQMRRRYRWPRLFDTLYFALQGLAGLLLTFLIFVSVHEATSPNWLYLWLNPLCFIGAVAPWLKCGKRLEVCYQIVNFALLIVLAVAILLGAQSVNPAFVPLIGASALRALANIRWHR